MGHSADSTAHPRSASGSGSRRGPQRPFDPADHESHASRSQHRETMGYVSGCAAGSKRLISLVRPTDWLGSKSPWYAHDKPKSQTRGVPLHKPSERRPRRYHRSSCSSAYEQLYERRGSTTSASPTPPSRLVHRPLHAPLAASQASPGVSPSSSLASTLIDRHHHRNGDTRELKRALVQAKRRSAEYGRQIQEVDREIRQTQAQLEAWRSQGK
jgi:hypothetical protein